MNMSNTYVCTVDGKSFDSKADAIAYIRSNYIQEIVTNEQLARIKEQLDTAFPDFYAEVEEKDGYLCTLKGIHVTGSFSFFLSPNASSSSLCTFSTIEEAIQSLDQLFSAISQHRTKLLDFLLQQTEPIQSILFHTIRQEEDDDDHLLSVEYMAVLADQSLKPIETVYIPLDDLIDPMDVTNVFEEAYTHFTNLYVTSVEGTPKEVISEHYYEDTDFLINNVSLNQLMSRAKKIRITIVE